MKLAEKFQTLMAAVAFAEENEPATAREIAREALEPPQRSRDTRTTITGTLAVNHGK
jgi:hypothetical protein